MTTNTEHLSMPYGRGTVEVLCSHHHPAHGPVVAEGPYGMKWVRREIFACNWTRRGQGYLIDFFCGGGGFYCEGNVRNLVVFGPKDAGYADGRAGRSNDGKFYPRPDDRADYEFGYKYGAKDTTFAADNLQRAEAREAVQP